MSTVVIDLGAASIKLGMAGSDGCVNVPNSETKRRGDKRRYLGAQVDDRTDYSGMLFRLPFEKVEFGGFLTDWSLQKEILDLSLFGKGMNCDPNSSSLIVTEPCFNFPSIRTSYDEIFFEEYGFSSVFRGLGT
ncbi:Actin- protein 6 [Irineochytrium annulatum]|nr:Actin- protein 6 [Irineochytrium annulatum]